VKIIGNKIIRQKECFLSSIDWAKELFETVPEGTVFLADTYHTARGRQGRIWNLYPGQLIITFVLKPEEHRKKVTDTIIRYLNMALTVGVARSLEVYGVVVKWPNDFMIYDKKAGGILVEAVWRDGKIQGIIVGIAINGNNIFLPDDPLYDFAISLKNVTDSNIDNEHLVQAMMQSIDIWYKYWIKGDYKAIFLAWKELQAFIGRKISVHRKDQTIVCGIIGGISRNGNIVLFDNDGQELEVDFCLIERVDSL